VTIEDLTLMGTAIDVAAHRNLYCAKAYYTNTMYFWAKCYIFIRNVKRHLKQGILLVKTKSRIPLIQY
jgi:hypothetical protein